MDAGTGPAAALAAVDLTAPRSQVLLALADDALVAGHRASHWTGVAPTIEEDLAFSTIAQDGVTEADLWLGILVGDGGPDRAGAVDALGLGRAPEAYRHAVLCERPPRDFGFSLARHWVLTAFAGVRLAALQEATDPEVAAVARKLAHERRYHVEHAELWFDRLTGAGTPVAAGPEPGDERSPRERFAVGLRDALAEAPGLAEPVLGEDDPEAAGVLPGGHAALWDRFLAAIRPRLEAADLVELVPPTSAGEGGGLGGRRGAHTADFLDDVWPEMTALYRAHPGARW